MNEVWILRVKAKGHPMPPAMDGGGDNDDCFLAWPSKEMAERGKKHQCEHYDFSEDELEVVRLA